MARIFISYRREDSSGYAGRVYDHLERHFGKDNVFFDIDTLAPGADFLEVISSTIKSCHILLVIIGRSWLTLKDEEGRVRLGNSDDFLRVEIATALDRDVQVIPVLVENSRMPRLEDLPEDVAELARRHAFAIPDAEFRAAMNRLIEEIEKAAETIEATRAAGRKRLEVGQGQDAPLTLRGHTESVGSVAWSPDGKRLATGSDDKTAKVWNVDTGRELLTLRGHSECVRRVEWTWDREREMDTLVSASMDGWWKIWNADTGERLHEDHAGAEGWLTAWRPTGNWSGNWLAHNLDAESSWDGSGVAGVMVHCLETGEGLIFHHRDLVRSIAWSPDGMRLATGTTDGTVRVWDAGAGKELRILRGHGDSVTSLAWDPGGGLLASASEDGNVKVWIAWDGRQLLTLASQLSKVWSVAWHPLKYQLAMGSEDGTARGCDATTGKELLALSGHASGVRSVAWAPDGSRLATASDDKTTNVWDVGGKCA